MQLDILLAASLPATDASGAIGPPLASAGPQNEHGPDCCGFENWLLTLLAAVSPLGANPVSDVGALAPAVLPPNEANAEASEQDSGELPEGPEELLLSLQGFLLTVAAEPIAPTPKEDAPASTSSTVALEALSLSTDAASRDRPSVATLLVGSNTVLAPASPIQEIPQPDTITISLPEKAGANQAVQLGSPPNPVATAPALPSAVPPQMATVRPPGFAPGRSVVGIGKAWNADSTARFPNAENLFIPHRLVEALPSALPAVAEPALALMARTAASEIDQGTTLLEVDPGGEAQGAEAESAPATGSGVAPSRISEDLQRPAPAHQVADAVLHHLDTQRSEEPTTFSFRLDPPELGTVRVSVTATEHGVSARLVVEHEGTRLLLESQLPSLRQRLQEAGVALGSFDVARDGGHPGGRHRFDEQPLDLSPRANRPLSAPRIIASSARGTNRIDAIA